MDARGVGDRRLRLALQLAQELVGFPRQLGTYPGGFVLTQTSLSNLVPMVARRDSASYNSVEEVWRRAEVPPAALERLAEAEGFRGMGLDRRWALGRVPGSACLAMLASRWCRCSQTTPHTSEGSTVPASDPIRARIEAFNQARGGGVAVHKAGCGYSFTSERTRAPLARLKPAGNADTVQVLWWNGQCWAAPGPFGITTMPLDAALDLIASEPHFWINA